MTNKNASEMAKLRWKGTTKKQRSEHGKMMVASREAKKHEKISKGSEGNNEK